MLAVILLCSPVTLLAQIPSEMLDVMKKCETKMDNSAGLASMRITVTRIKIGVSDDVFKFDPKKYANAVVVRK